MNQPISRKSDAKEVVLNTAKWMAALRAKENERSDRLFADPFAAKLAGDEGMNWLNSPTEETSEQDRPYVPVRTRFFDDFLMAVVPDVTQIVILGAGMDTRAFRLGLSDRLKIFEIDQFEILKYKEAILKNEPTSCSRVSIKADISQPWSHLLLEQGYIVNEPSVWLLEGLLMYFTETEVRKVLKTVSELTSTGSWLGCDLLNVKAINASTEPDFQGYWLSGFDRPEELLAEYGWQAEVVQPGEDGANFDRFKRKFPSRYVSDVERVFLIKATK